MFVVPDRRTQRVKTGDTDDLTPLEINFIELVRKVINDKVGEKVEYMLAGTGDSLLAAGVSRSDVLFVRQLAAGQNISFYRL